MVKNTTEVYAGRNGAAHGDHEQLMLQAVKYNCCCHLLGLAVWYLFLQFNPKHLKASYLEGARNFLAKRSNAAERYREISH